MRDLGVVLSQCAHVVVLEEEDSFEFDPEEELDIPGGDDGDGEETDDDYVPEGGSGSSGESDGERGDIQEAGMGTIQRGQVQFVKRGWVKFRKRGWVKFIKKQGRVKFKKRGWVMFLQKKGRVKFRKGVGKVHTKKGEGKIQKEGVGKVHTKKGEGKIQKEDVGVTPKEGEGSGMGTGTRGSKRKRSATPPPPRSPGVRIKAKMPVQTTHRAEGMVQHQNIKNEVGATIGHCYRCKECAFECATRAACVAHARRKHTDELIDPCDYCGTYYAHSADSMRHHVNECAGRTTSSDNSDD